MKRLFVLPLLVLSGSIYAAEPCMALSWKAERDDAHSVIVQGEINKPNTLVFIELWKLDKLIGTGTAVSNARGVFLDRVYTERRAPKYPNVAITCR